MHEHSFIIKSLIFLCNLQQSFSLKSVLLQSTIFFYGLYIVILWFVNLIWSATSWLAAPRLTSTSRRVSSSQTVTFRLTIFAWRRNYYLIADNVELEMFSRVTFTEVFFTKEFVQPHLIQKVSSGWLWAHCVVFYWFAVPVAVGARRESLGLLRSDWPFSFPFPLIFIYLSRMAKLLHAALGRDQGRAPRRGGG